MIIFVIIGTILLIFGLIMVLFPVFVIKLNEDANRILFTDAKFFSAPRLSGILYFGVGIIFVVVNLFYDFQYNYLFGIIGAISVVIGIIFFAKPRLLIKFNEVGSRIVFSERKILNFPRVLGIVLSVLSLYMIYLGFTLK